MSQLVFVGSKRPLNVTVSSICGDRAPVTLRIGIFNVTPSIERGKFKLRKNENTRCNNPHLNPGGHKSEVEKRVKKNGIKIIN